MERLLGPVLVTRFAGVSWYSLWCLSAYYTSAFECNKRHILFWQFLLFQALMIPIQMSYPFIANLSGLSQSLMLNCASILVNVLSVSSKQSWFTSMLNLILSFFLLCVYVVYILKKRRGHNKTFLACLWSFQVSAITGLLILQNKAVVKQIKHYFIFLRGATLSLLKTFTTFLCNKTTGSEAKRGG